MREMGPINLFLVDLNLVEDFVVVLLFFRLKEQPFRQKNFVFLSFMCTVKNH